jgi:phytoene dehydrogenase-like protein
LRERAADDLLALVGEYAPNLPGAIRRRLVETPLDLERRFGLRRGNCMHIDLSPDQMFFMRPLPELSGYRAPLKNLYLTGAGTHPIGGVTGMPGRNAAGVILRDLGA